MFPSTPPEIFSKPLEMIKSNPDGMSTLFIKLNDSANPFTIKNKMNIMLSICLVTFRMGSLFFVVLAKIIPVMSKTIIV